MNGENSLEKKAVKFFFILLYALYTFVALNIRLEDPIIPNSQYFTYIYIFGITLLIFFNSRSLSIKTNSIAVRTLFSLSLYIAIFSLITFIEGPIGDLGEETLAFVKYIIVASLTVYIVKRYNMFPQFLLASFLGGSALLLYEYAIAGFPLDIFSHLGVFFSTTYSLRYRLAFNFNNYNTVGNIASALLIIYCLWISWLKHYGQKKMFLTMEVSLCTVIAALDLIILLSSGSRNSLMTLAIFAIAWFYFKTGEFERIPVRQQRIFRALLLFIGVVIIYVTTFTSLFDMFATSGRMKSFLINVPLVLDRQRFFEGLGLMNPGYFGRGQMGYIVDNYYLYVFLETGIIGLIMILFILAGIGRNLQKLRRSKEPFYLILSAAFIAWLMSGMGESCVIYPYFASSLIYLVTFLSVPDVIKKNTLSPS